MWPLELTAAFGFISEAAAWLRTTDKVQRWENTKKQTKTLLVLVLIWFIDSNKNRCWQPYPLFVQTHHIHCVNPLTWLICRVWQVDPFNVSWLVCQQGRWRLPMIVTDRWAALPWRRCLILTHKHSRSKHVCDYSSRSSCRARSGAFHVQWWKPTGSWSF